MRAIDLTGMTFGTMTVLRREGTKHTFATWLVRCECGVEKVISGHSLRGGQKSCGCKKESLRLAAVITHGRSGDPTYRSWSGMKGRCSNPEDPSYQRYGGRGIKMCVRWESFENFLADMGERPSADHSLDRMDVNGPYSPGNCRWATTSEQQRNRRSNRRLVYGGVSLTLVEWSERTGIGSSTISERLRRGWSLHDALTGPVLSPSEQPRFDAPDGSRPWAARQPSR